MCKAACAKRIERLGVTQAVAHCGRRVAATRRRWYSIRGILAGASGRQLALVRVRRRSNMTRHAPASCSSADGSSREAATRRIVRLSFLVSLGSLVVKGVIGVLCGSQALVADATHTLIDTLAFGINSASAESRRSDRREASSHHHLVVGALLFVCGVFICCHNTAILIAGTRPHPGLWGLVVAACAVPVTWYLYAVSQGAAEPAADPAVRVCAIQNRTNFFSAGVSLVGVGLAELGLTVCDPLSALVIGAFMTASALEIFYGVARGREQQAGSIGNVLTFGVAVMSLGMLGYFTYDVGRTLQPKDVVLIPSQGASWNSPADAVLGRAQYFTVVDRKRGTATVVPNGSRYHSGDVSNHLLTLVKANGVQAVVAQKIGAEMFSDLSDAGVTMRYFHRAASVGTVLAAYGRGRLELARAPNVARGYGRSQLRWLEPW